MFGDLDKYIFVFLTGLAVSYLLTPVVKKLAFQFGVVDMPNARRPHQRPTARGGGVALFIAVQVACFLAVAFPWSTKLAGELDLTWWWHFALASSVLFVVGIIDDVRGMKPLIKLGGQTLAALLMALSETHFGPFLGKVNLPAPLDALLVVIWLVAIINAFNLIDGLDGLASGLAVISAIGLCGILTINHLSGDVLVLLGFIGACLGFLRYNFHPASIFLGDTGSMFIGFTLGVVSLQTVTKNSFLISLTIPMLVLGVPIYDAVLAIWRRTVRKWTGDATGVKRGIMQPDLEHLHHRLKFAGLSTGRVAAYLCVLNGALVLVGLLIALYQSQAAGIFLIALLGGVYLVMRHLAVIELRETGRALLTGLRRPTHSTFKALSYPICDMIWLAGSLALIMWVVEQQRVDFWHTWFLDLPVWVTPTFSLLAISRAYVTYWPRARLRDVITLVFWLQAGILFSLALALLIDHSQSEKWVLRAVLVAAISHPVIIASRIIYRCVEELALWIQRQNDVTSATERVLLYGSGARAQLFLRDCATRNSKTPDKRVIIGFVDDEKALHFQWTYGHLVLGGTQELAHLIAKWKINRIIIVADLLPESWKSVREIASREGVHLSEWFPQEHEIYLTTPQKTDIVEALNKSS